MNAHKCTKKKEIDKEKDDETKEEIALWFMLLQCNLWQSIGCNKKSMIRIWNSDMYFDALYFLIEIKEA